MTVTDTCSIVHYIAGGMMTEGRYVNPDHAKACSDVGRWYPIPAGFRSEDGRTLILRDAASRYHDWAKAKAADDSASAMRANLASHPAVIAERNRKREIV